MVGVEVEEEEQWVHGLEEDHSATYLHGRDQDGYLVEDFHMEIL